MKTDHEKRKGKAYSSKPMSDETREKLREKLREYNRKTGKLTARLNRFGASIRRRPN